MLICGIELFVFTEKSQLYSYTVDLSQEWFQSLHFFQFHFEVQTEEAIQLLLGTCYVASGLQWITVVVVCCVYRKVSQVLESI